MGLDGTVSIGLVYTLPLHGFIEAHPSLVEILEIEPQTLWFYRPDGFAIDHARLRRVAALAPRICAHGVGAPVGTARPRPAAYNLFAESVQQIGAEWASEHLSFNQACVDGRLREAGFLLPPCPTEAGVAAAITAISAVKRSLSVPFAVENGVSYLRPGRVELPDGDWLREVLEGADCLLVLDLHNAWCNQKNGRQSMEDFLRALPLERVIELHLAGGEALDGFWLDAHRGLVPDAVMALARELTPELPRLQAILYEVSATAAGELREAQLVAQLEALHALCPPVTAAPRPGAASAPPIAARREATEWEDALLGALLNPPTADEDPGLALYRRLIQEFRLSNLIGALPFTARYLLLTIPRAAHAAHMERYLAEHPPSPFAPAEAEVYAAHLEDALPSPDPALRSILQFELAILRALTADLSSRVNADVSLLPLLMELAVCEVGPPVQESSWTLVTPQGVEYYDGEDRLLARTSW